MINLKEQAVKGATVHFRCGGSAEIINYHILGSKTNYDYLIGFRGLHAEFHIGENDELDDMCNNAYSFIYSIDGAYGEALEGDDCIFDIIRIEPPKFDWSTVQKGDAFTDLDGDLCFYVGLDPQYNQGDMGIFKFSYIIESIALSPSCLTPAPEHNKTEWRD